MLSLALNFKSQLPLLFLTLTLINANINAPKRQMGGTGPWVATTDAPVMIEFDETTLETKGLLKMKDTIVSLGGIEIGATAHPHLDKKTG
jgi:hypothetical protein